jgi:hypothetical protein
MVTMPKLTDAQIEALPEEFRGIATHVNSRLAWLPGDEDMSEVALGTANLATLLAALAEARTAVVVLAELASVLCLRQAGGGCTSCPRQHETPHPAMCQPDGHCEWAYAEARAKLAEEATDGNVARQGR